MFDQKTMEYKELDLNNLHVELRKIYNDITIVTKEKNNIVKDIDQVNEEIKSKKNLNRKLILGNIVSCIVGSIMALSITGIIPAVICVYLVISAVSIKNTIDIHKKINLKNKLNNKFKAHIINKKDLIAEFKKSAETFNLLESAYKDYCQCYKNEILSEKVDEYQRNINEIQLDVDKINSMYDLVPQELLENMIFIELLMGRNR